MDSRELKLPMGVQDIQKCIPHRFPFLLIDQILELKPGVSIVAIKNISIADPILQGHFPDNPVYPGVLQVEAMAQASAVLGYYSKENNVSKILLAEVSEARFRRQVVPGDSLRIQIGVDKMRSPFFWFHGEAFVGEELAVKARISALMQ